jgi:hypothetical protein
VTKVELQRLHNSDQSGVERVTHQVRQAVMGRGFDENLEQGARCSSQPTTHNVRACLWKILQRNFPHRRSSRCQIMHLPAHGLRTSNLQTNQRRKTSQSIFKTHILEEN